jgi:hypothetical protein
VCVGGRVTQALSPAGSVRWTTSILFSDSTPSGVPLQNLDLMTEREVLQGQLAAGLQGREERSEKDEYHGGHDTMRSS